MGLIRIAITMRPDDLHDSVNCKATRQVDNSSISHEISYRGTAERTTITE